MPKTADHVNGYGSVGHLLPFPHSIFNLEDVPKWENVARKVNKEIDRMK